MTRHLYIFGTAGEGYAVSDELFHHVAGVFYEESQRCQVIPMLGLISQSLPTVIDRIEFALDLGYRQFQISFPSWGTVSDAERDLFFRETCGRFLQAQFLHYNVGRSGRLLTGADYCQLAKRHPNLVAIKFTSSDRSVVHELVSRAYPIQCFLTEHAYLLAREIVQCGLLVSLSGVRLGLPHRFTAAREADLPGLWALSSEIETLLRRSVSSTSPLVHMDGAYEKIIARAHGGRLPLRLFPPYQGADEASCRLFLEGLRILNGLD